MNHEQATARCWVEVDLDVVEANYRSAERICGPGVRVIPVLKANAYGLGAAVLSRYLRECGARLFAVATLEEALAVKAACGGDALVMGMVAPCELDRAIRAGVILTVYSLDQARAVNAAAERAGISARVHVKLDTGLHRLGFDPSATGDLLAALALPRLSAEGLFTHLALRDRAADDAQVARLREVADILRARGIPFGLTHACDSIGMVRYPEYRFDAVRIGAWLYGVVPSGYPNSENECRLPLRFMTRVAQVRRVKKGEYLGYDETHPLPADRTIATLCAGYADGYPRVNSAGMVAIRGQRAPVAGLTCMDQMMADVTDIEGVRPGDPVTLLGDGIALNALSEWTGTHRNELLSHLGRRVPRIYTRGGNVVEIDGGV